MSLAVLDKDHRAQAGVTIYLSTDGSGGVPVEALKPTMQAKGMVIAAFDADQAGELMAWRVAEQLPGLRRLIPNSGKDWNEQLKNPESLAPSTQANKYPTEVKQLWRWHYAAENLGRQEAYLSRITAVAKETLKGTPLSENAREAMTRDIEQFSQNLDMKKVSISPAHASIEIGR
jgi:DNA primase